MYTHTWTLRLGPQGGTQSTPTLMPHKDDTHTYTYMCIYTHTHIHQHLHFCTDPKLGTQNGERKRKKRKGKRRDEGKEKKEKGKRTQKEKKGERGKEERNKSKGPRVSWLPWPPPGGGANSAAQQKILSTPLLRLRWGVLKWFFVARRLPQGGRENSKNLQFCPLPKATIGRSETLQFSSNSPIGFSELFSKIVFSKNLLEFR